MQIASFGPLASVFPPEAAAVTEVVFDENFDGGLSGWNLTVCQVTANPPDQECILATRNTFNGVSPPSSPNWGIAGVAKQPNCLPGSIKATFEKKFNVANEGDYTLSATMGGPTCDICKIFAQLFLDGVEKFKREGRNTLLDGSGPPFIFSEQTTVHLTAGMHTIGIGGGVVPPASFPFVCAGFFGGFFDDIIVQREIIPVSIDIEPGSFPNAINPSSQGVIPVAILTTSSFDASTVDPKTVEFGPNNAPAVKSSMQDVNGDGLLDMVLQFNTQRTGIACGQTSATLTGQTLAGIPIEGSDSIKTVPCK